METKRCQRFIKCLSGSWIMRTNVNSSCQSCLLGDVLVTSIYSSDNSLVVTIVQLVTIWITQSKKWTKEHLIRFASGERKRDSPWTKDIQHDLTLLKHERFFRSLGLKRFLFFLRVIFFFPMHHKRSYCVCTIVSPNICSRRTKFFFARAESFSSVSLLLGWSSLLRAVHYCNKLL